MEIDPELEKRSLQDALAKYPRFEAYCPRLVARPLFQGHAFVVEYSTAPARDDADAWEFQNAVVKGYKRLAGIR